MMRTLTCLLALALALPYLAASEGMNPKPLLEQLESDEFEEIEVVLTPIGFILLHP